MYSFKLARARGAEPVIPIRRDSRVKDAPKVGRDFDSWGAKAGRGVQGPVQRGTTVRHGEGVAAAGVPQAPGLGAGGHLRGSEIHGDAGGGSCGCTVP